MGTNDADPQLKQGWIYTLRLLAISNRSKADLVKRLRDKGYDDGVIEVILERLSGAGILNEQHAVREAVRWAIQGKHQGRKRIRFELTRKGYEKNAVTEELERYTPDEEKAQALMLARNKLESTKEPDSRKRMKQVYELLLRRGFDYSLAKEIAVDVIQESKKHEDIGNS